MRAASHWTIKNRLILRTVLCLGFSFMLRSSEFRSRGGAGWDFGKVLRPCDIELREEGRKLGPGEWHRATEVSIYLRSSKSDQYNEGCLLTHHLASEQDMDLCVVRAVRDLAMSYPSLWEEEAHLPLSRWENGKPVTRDEIRRMLSNAAVEQGLPESAVSVHSLRSGGASALFQAS